MNKYFIAIDIGASSGRHIIGHMHDGQLMTDEVYRFPNGMEEYDGHLVWNMDKILTEVKKGISIAFAKYGQIESISIDTWGVDYVLMRGDKEVLPTYAYRDSRTEAIIDEVHKKIPFEKLYARTGMQFQPFNTIYQLYADKKAGRLDGVTDFLMLPEYLNYKLTGKKVKEYTNATTTGMISVSTHNYDNDIISKLGFSSSLFASLHQPGTVIGSFTDEVAEAVGGQTKVVLCASHDTASAVASIDMQENVPYISSGTWSLLGIKQDVAHTDKDSMLNNFTNEGGLNNTFRYQKNIMGMWIVGRVLEELPEKIPVQVFVMLAQNSSFEYTIDINEACFLAPASMIDTIKDNLKEHQKQVPTSVGDIANCIYHSLALSYHKTVTHLEQILNKTFKTLYIVGGGAKNAYLNNLTAKYTKKEIIALPIEATAIGNLKVQMEVKNG